MVDADQVEARLQRLEQMLEQLEEVRSAGEDAYLADARQRLATERLLQLAIQICIDLGAQVVSEQSAAAPSSYSDVFKILGDKEVISADVAERLGNAARQRNLLVHLYMEIDDRAVFASLAYLDDLREFAAAVGRLADSAVNPDA
ncbi:MAG TPA: DUF86 domain-containing protein [Solirubrobacterales bacterium]|nr:DUF86 domain-containing protein [Solirubrobacterales bacterium]